MTSATDAVDVVVIGLGPGGEDAAGKLALAGLSVVGVDARLVGGECPYFGCIPSKIIIRGANAVTEGRRVPLLAGSSSVTPDFGQVAKRIREEATDNWNDQAAVDRLVGKGVRIIHGHARLTGPKTVEVNGETITARRGVLINTGTEPFTPPITGLADTPYWTNREILQAEAAPESLCVLGGGPIGVEMAQAFSRLGSRVTVVQSAPRLVPVSEPEASEVLASVFAAEGIGVHVGASADAVSYSASAGFAVSVGGEEVRAERLLVATGRRNNLTELGLETVGLDPTARSLSPDEHMRVADGLWAIGDITGKGAFTHMSMYQAAVAIRDILGEPGQGAQYHAVPHVTFTDPEIGGVGLTEAQARERGLRVRVGRSQIPESSRGWIHKVGNEGLIKVVEDADRGVLVGATSVGPTGGEVLSALVVAVHGEVPVSTLRGMIYAYPTFHRAIEAAIADLH